MCLRIKKIIIKRDLEIAVDKLSRLATKLLANCTHIVSSNHDLTVQDKATLNSCLSGIIQAVNDNIAQIKKIIFNKKLITSNGGHKL